jgi:multiple sugar transport system permease protein
MSEQLSTCLISVAANLAGMFVIYSVMAHLLARLGWRGRGVFGIIAVIIVAQLFWIAPALLIVGRRDPDDAASYALWFGNWLVSGFGLILLWQAALRMPRQLEDSARLDGLGVLAVWWHIVFPSAKRDLVLLAIFTVMATLLPFLGFVTFPDAGKSIVLYQRFLSPSGRAVAMALGSLAGTLPLIAIFFMARAKLPADANQLRA